MATFDAGDARVNTLALPGRDIVVPLQQDLDCDPLQDDEVRLSSCCGSFEQVLFASDADAVPDDAAAMVHYRFRNVPPNYYRLSVRIGTQWVDITTDLVVTPRGAWLHGRLLTAEPPESRYRHRTAAPAPADPPPPPAGRPRIPDLNDSYRDHDRDLGD